MKIGRNDKCPCGSGKKYKKCCIDKEGPVLPAREKHYFQLKGKEAEGILHDLSIRSFLTDWCYLNPKLPNGKELCDLLVVFDDTAIIWQVKSLKLHKDGKYKKKEVEKNHRQLMGARRKLFDLKSEINLENPRRGREPFKSTSIRRVFLISVFMGPPEDYYSIFERIDNYGIHVLSGDFLEIILNELDTVADFCDYLSSKEKLFKESEITINGGEEELLAYFIMNDKSFSEFEGADGVVLDGDIWAHLVSLPEYKKKKEADEISYGWDHIINRVHECSDGYEIVARELARPNRFNRRVLSKVYLDAHVRAHNDRDHPMLRRLFDGNGVSYIFLFFSDAYSREDRKALLAGLCFFARGFYKQNLKVIGIATEKVLKPTCSYDFCLLEKDDWTTDDQKKMLELQKELSLFINPKVMSVREDEFPQ